MNSIDVARTVFEEGWNRQDFTHVRGMLAAEFLLHVGGATHVTDVDAFETIVARWHEAFAEFRFEVDAIVGDDRMAAVRATLHGVHRGVWGGLEPTGRTVAVDHAFFLAIEDGLVTEVWEILDSAQLRQQLGEQAG